MRTPTAPTVTSYRPDSIIDTAAAEDEIKAISHPVTHLGTGLVSAESEADLPEAEKRHITEFDLVAYSKADMSQSVQKNIMNRMFCAFDVTQKGYLTEEKIAELIRYLGRHISDSQLHQMFSQFDANDGKVTFEKFWNWWITHPDTKLCTEAFSLISVDFSVPYHQQQLITKNEGEMFTPSFRIHYFFKNMETGEVRPVSPWHDIPLYVCDPVRTKPEYLPPSRYNFICEIPKWTRAKFEIATDEAYNPIKQDIKNGLPRFYKHGDMMWNYGAFPQTWESTEVAFMENIHGDNDPIDGIEIGMMQFKVGQVGAVKILGVLGMIDDGQMDWKIICISHNDPIARFVRDITDVPKFLPGCLDAIREWLRVYKICQGGVENKFAFDGEFKDKQFALKILSESHHMWENLRKIKQQEKF